MFVVKMNQNSTTFRFRKASEKLVDVDIDFCAMWVPTWAYLETQVGVISASEIAQMPPQTPPKTRLGARNHPDPHLGLDVVGFFMFF